MIAQPRPSWLERARRWAVRVLMSVVLPTSVLVSLAAAQSPSEDLAVVAYVLVFIGVVGLICAISILAHSWSGAGGREPWPRAFTLATWPRSRAARVPGVIATAALILAGLHVATGFGPLSDLIGQQSWAAGLDVTPWRLLIALLVVQCAASLVEGLVDEHERSVKR